MPALIPSAPLHRIAVLVAGIAITAQPGCKRAPSSDPPPAAAVAPPDRGPWFEEVAEQRGLIFVHQSGHEARYLFPEIMCGGAALFDMDSDGDLDAYLVQSGSLTRPHDKRPTNQLFANDGAGTFRNVTAGSGADDRGYGMGVAAGDYDNDGDIDLYVTNVGANTLLRNDGTGKFTDVTRAAAVGDPGWGSSAAFFDADADGDLDLFVVNYVRWSVDTELDCFKHTDLPDYCSPKNYNAPQRDVLYRNNGDGTFTDVSRAAGLDTAFGNGLGLVCADFNSDGAADVFVANDGMENQLWLNRGQGRFENAAMMAGCAVDHDGAAKAGMGVAAADIDDDDDVDLLVVNLHRESDSFYRNEGDYFADNTAAAGLGTATRRFTRFGLALLDFDNDGRLDLYIANGRVGRQSDQWSDDPFAEPNQLLRGTDSGRFEEVLPRGGTTPALVATSRAAAFGDVDGDGGIDVLIVNRDAPANLLHNVAADPGHWILFRVLDQRGRDALGATLRLTVGRRRIRRDVISAYSYCAANDPRVHVGLGAATRVSGVSVTWPDGVVESFGDYAADRVVTLRRTARTARSD